MPAQDTTGPRGDIWVKLEDKKNDRLAFKLSVSADIAKYFKKYRCASGFLHYRNDHYT